MEESGLMSLFETSVNETVTFAYIMTLYLTAPAIGTKSRTVRNEQWK